MIATIRKVPETVRTLCQELGREPTTDEIAERLNITLKKLEEIMQIAQDPVSLETPVGEKGDSRLGDLIESIEDSEDIRKDNRKVVYHTQEEVNFDKLRVFAPYDETFLTQYKIFNPKVLCKAFPKYPFQHKYADGEGSILLSYPIISRIDNLVIGNKRINIIDFLSKCTEGRLKECSEEILGNCFVDMYEDYYKSKKDLKHTAGGEITQEQQKLISNKFSESPLCNEIKQAKSWGDISIYSIFNCAIKRFASGKSCGQISLHGFVENLKIFPEFRKIFPWNREHFRKIIGWINGEHSSHDNENANYLFNDFISALVFKGYIKWEFGEDSTEFNNYLHKISRLRNFILQADDPTMLYMRSIEDICSVYCIKNGYPLPSIARLNKK
jgi:hypothetical protein